jgi:hypothetical protein
VVYAKAPFAGPEAVLSYLSRYTHRVAISNSRLIAFDKIGVTFRYKNYRRTGADRQQVMTLATDEFIRRFLLHVQHAASIASGTAACSPAPHARPALRWRANSWKSPRRPMTTPGEPEVARGFLSRGFRTPACTRNPSQSS